MGKIRVKTVGDEELDKKVSKKEQAKLDAIKKAEAAKAAAEARKNADQDATSNVAEAEPRETETQRKSAPRSAKISEVKKQKHSKSYVALASQVDKNKKYSLKEALTLLDKVKRGKFDETVELHINTTDKGISGSLTLPHGTGKQARVVIANQSEDAKAVDELVKKIEAGQIDFDVLIATPDTMPKLARVARVLGPRGLMPNPKNGTVAPKPEEVAKKFEGGQINFKTESKFPLLHLAVGKISFGEQKLAENIKVAVDAVKTKNIKTATLKSTMSPGIKLDTASL